MIHLILVRHGRRLRRHQGHLDPLDPLDPSEQGLLQARAQQLSGLSKGPTHILTSRHLHARATASMLAEAFGVPQEEVRVVAFLTPSIHPSSDKYHDPD